MLGYFVQNCGIKGVISCRFSFKGVVICNVLCGIFEKFDIIVLVLFSVLIIWCVLL